MKVLSDDDDDDSDDFVPMTMTNRSSAAKQKPPSPVISSDSFSESVDSLSDSESKSSAENNNEVHSWTFCYFRHFIIALLHTDVELAKLTVCTICYLLFPFFV